jgi:hypothetical protein
MLKQLSLFEDSLKTELPVLRLNLKKKYFEEILRGIKTEEYRLCSEFWSKRLVNKSYSAIEICLGYPKKGDNDRTLRFPYRGFKVKPLVHPEFGDQEVQVYAIELKP